MTRDAIDQEARDAARDAEHHISEHEKVCAERYAGIEKSFRSGSERMAALSEGQSGILKSIDTMRRDFLTILIGGGAGLITVLVGATAWLISYMAQILKLSGHG